jgi:hypothetical protein
VAAPKILVSSVMDRLKTHPYGLMGGLPGASGGLFVRRKGDKEFRTFVEAFGTASPGKFSGITVTEGDEILIVGPGGGGYGSPSKRLPEKVLEDVLDGLVSIESARRDYGLVIEEVGGEVRIVKDIRDTLEFRQVGSSPQKRALQTPNQPAVRLIGRWQTRSPRLYEIEALTCDVCGKVIPGDTWVVDEDGRMYRFCDQDCERLYRDYWQLRYGDCPSS